MRPVGCQGGGIAGFAQAMPAMIEMDFLYPKVACALIQKPPLGKADLEILRQGIELLDWIAQAINMPEAPFFGGKGKLALEFFQTDAEGAKAALEAMKKDLSRLLENKPLLKAKRNKLFRFLLFSETSRR